MGDSNDSSALTESDLNLTCIDNQYDLALKAYKKIVRGSKVSEGFEVQLENCISIANDEETLQLLIEMLGVVGSKNCSSIFVDYLSDARERIRLTAFVSAIRQSFEELKDKLQLVYVNERSPELSFYMLKNLVQNTDSKSCDITRLVENKILSKREVRLLERKGIIKQ